MRLQRLGEERRPPFLLAVELRHAGSSASG
jgi:hypothetical protein